VEDHKRFVRQHDGKKPLGKLRYKWENTTEMDLKETGWKGMN